MTASTLQITTPTDLEVKIMREFRAPRVHVFDAWTKPELLQRWLIGPDGWKLVVCEMDIRPGGSLRWVWRNPKGKEMGLSGIYREVARPERIIHTELFDEDWTGGETLVTIAFTEKSNVTTQTMTIRYASLEARNMALKSGMEIGMELGYAVLDQILSGPQQQQ